MTTKNPNSHLTAIQGSKGDEAVPSKVRDTFDRLLPPIAVLTTVAIIGGYAIRGVFSGGGGPKESPAAKAEANFKQWPAGHEIELTVKQGQGAIDPGIYAGDSSSTTTSEGLTRFIQDQGKDGFLQEGQQVTVPIIDKDSPFQPLPTSQSSPKP